MLPNDRRTITRAEAIVEQECALIESVYTLEPSPGRVV